MSEPFVIININQIKSTLVTWVMLAKTDPILAFTFPNTSLPSPSSLQLISTFLSGPALCRFKKKKTPTKVLYCLSTSGKHYFRR